MKIDTIFEKDIFRPINGVVKADQLDPDTIWQELDEFVVTAELDEHLRSFFTVYCDSINNRNDASNAGKIGVWASGFFGSGKSHLLKILSYLLENKEHQFNGEKKKALAFFEGKIKDPMVYGDMKRAVAADTEVILFNIDSKAVAGSGRDAILSVFLKVFNEKLGFCGDFPHIAHMERFLNKENKLSIFHEKYKSKAGNDWLSDRVAWEFHRDELVTALAETLGQSQASCEKWVDRAESSFALSIENLAKWIKEYLDNKGPNNRIIFLVDEIGQFVGTDSQLMLTLQTIVEELGTICKGRAWVVVTSQEDIDAVLGPMRTVKNNDFSKIQGRFKTRLSLSSKNVDEVIQKRLLSKKTESVNSIKEVFVKKGDIIKNQLTFQDVGMTFKEFADADDFVKNYPFAPYQFKLLQKIFESIRKAGATGLHLSQGERSLVDAFQHAAKLVARQEIGVLVPLYMFYPSIESFLDTSVKRTIEHAKDNSSLEKFDALILQVLFLIRYVNEMKANVNNLVTLCIDEVDADRLVLKRKIEESLTRLEKETLISRSGDNFFFLTNEEQDINREVKNTEISSGDDVVLVSELMFQEIYRDERKFRYSVNKKDFDFNRMCDLRPFGRQEEGALLLSVISPLLEHYEDYTHEKCLLSGFAKENELLIVLPDKKDFSIEITNYLKSAKYIRTKDDGTLSHTTKSIHRKLADENRERRTRLMGQLGQMLIDARYYAIGSPVEAKCSTPKEMLTLAFEYLVKNSFSKMDYVAHLLENPLSAIQAVLRVDDVGATLVMIESTEGNPRAVAEVRSHIDLLTSASRQIVLAELIERFEGRPYGWPQLETLLILVRLIVAGEIDLIMSGAQIKKERAFDLISRPANWKSISVVKRILSRPEDVRKARELGNKLFSLMGPENQDPLAEFLREHFESWQAKLLQFKGVAEGGRYPGAEIINLSLTKIKDYLRNLENVNFIRALAESGESLLELRDKVHDVENFYGQQRSTWDKLVAAKDRYSQNESELNRNEESKRALRRISEILAMSVPYSSLHESEGLIRTVDKVNVDLIRELRARIFEKINQQIVAISNDLRAVGADEQLQSACLGPINDLVDAIQRQESLAHLSQAQQEAIRFKDEAGELISAFLKKAKASAAGSKSEVPIKPKRVVKPADMVNAIYLETSDEVSGFINRLKNELDDAIIKNERIEIR